MEGRGGRTRTTNNNRKRTDRQTGKGGRKSRKKEKIKGGKRKEEGRLKKRKNMKWQEIDVKREIGRAHV